jgi:hypothetical protein
VVPERPSSEFGPELRRAVVKAVADTWDEGCPIAGSDQVHWEQIADVAIRRWHSIGRRRHKQVVHADRVEDLAKGLRDRFSPDPKLVGPLMEDYRYLAARIAKVLSAMT